MLCSSLNFPILGVGGRDILNYNVHLVFGVLFVLMKEHYIKKFGPKNNEQIKEYADTFLKDSNDVLTVEPDQLDELPFSVILFWDGESGELFMGDEDMELDIPEFPENLESAIVPPLEGLEGERLKFAVGGTSKSKIHQKMTFQDFERQSPPALEPKIPEVREDPTATSSKRLNKILEEVNLDTKGDGKPADEERMMIDPNNTSSNLRHMSRIITGSVKVTKPNKKAKDSSFKS